MTKHNCGVFAISSKKDIVDDLYLGTFYLQHRGQKYCGLSTSDGEKLRIRTHKGMVRETFSQDLGGMEGHMGIGHTSLEARQPILLDSKLGEFTIGFTGNIINSGEIIEHLKKEGHSFATNDDIEVIAKLIAQGNDFVDGIEKMAATIKGAYCLTLLTKEGIYVARDKRAYNPLVLGQRDGTVAVSSESCSFNNLGISIVRDIAPGEILLLKDGKPSTVKTIKGDMIQHCTFEWVYTANASSIIDGLCVDVARRNLGGALARRYPVKADIVAPVPNSGIGHAIGYAQESGIPYENVFIKYDYSSRSYTQPTQKERDFEAKIKLIAIAPKIEGKRIVLCDDSIVRGTQMKNDLVVKLRKAGAKEIHVRIACPPLKAPCQYGISTRSKKELAATNKTVEEIRKYIGVDSLGYNTIEDIEKALNIPRDKLCLSCWTDEYR